MSHISYYGDAPMTYEDWFRSKVGEALENTGPTTPHSEVMFKLRNKVAADPFKEQVGGDHYKIMKIQPIEYILANDLGFCEANIIKYISRYKQKNGVQDVKKVIHYAEMLLAHLEEQANGLT